MARSHVNEFTQTLGFTAPNLKFVHGYIEDLKSAGIEDDAVDMIISNCVVNLSPDKPSVLREAYRVLARGGELYFSDVYCDRRLPEHVQKHEVRLSTPPPPPPSLRACARRCTCDVYALVQSRGLLML